MNAPAQHTPRTMTRGRSRDGSKVIVSDSRTRTIAQFYGPDRDANSELFMQAEAERAAHAETLAALEDVLHESGWGRDGALDAATERERNTTLWLVARIAATALQQAKGGRS